MNYSKSKCPECNKILKDATKCYCGWKSNVSQSDAPVDPRCDFNCLGERCSMIGSISPNLREGGPWYCIWHFRAIGDLAEGRRALDFVSEHLSDIHHHRKFYNSYDHGDCERCQQYEKNEKDFQRGKRTSPFRHEKKDGMHITGLMSKLAGK